MFPPDADALAGKLSFTDVQVNILVTGHENIGKIIVS
jgi:hypothetical protein